MAHLARRHCHSIMFSRILARMTFESSTPPSDKRNNIFWAAFFYTLFIPLAFSGLTSLPFAGFVPAVGVVSFIAYKILFKKFPLFQGPVRGLLPLMVALFILMAASISWSFNPDATFHRAEKIIGLMIGSFAFLAVAMKCPPEQWQKYKLLFPIAAIMTALMTAGDIILGMPLYYAINHPPIDELRPDFLNKQISTFVMAFPVCFYITWKSRSVLLLSAIVPLAICLFFLTYSQAAQLAFVVTLLGAFGCLFFIEKLTLRSAFLGLAFLFLTLPWIAPTLFDAFAARAANIGGVMSKASTALRLENWDFLSRKIIENPLTGFGMDSTRYMKFDTQQLYFHNDSIMHPHNLALQMWIEFGVFGCAWALAFFGWYYLLLMRLKPSARLVGFLTFINVIVFLLVSWSVWSSWLIALIIYLSALCVLATRTTNDPLNS